MFYYIPTIDAIGNVFADCLGGLLSTTSNNLKITLTPRLGVQLIKIYSKFAITPDEVGPGMIVNIPDMQSEERREILVDLLLDSVDKAGNYTVLGVQLGYTDVIQNVDRSSSMSIAIERVGNFDSLDFDSVDLNVDRANNREIAMSAIEEAQELSEKGDTETANVVITSAIEAIGQSASAGDNMCLTLVTELHTIKNELSTRGYRSSTQCAMRSITSTHGYQRSGGTNTGDYITSTRKSMSNQCADYISGKTIQ